jgi:CHAT domain-containing protein
MRQPSLVVALAGVMLLAPAPEMPGQENQGKAELNALYQRGSALRKAGKHREAAEVFERVVALSRTVFGPGHINTANLTSQLATLYYVLNEHAKAVPLYRACLEIREAKLGKDHLHVAETLSSLGGSYRALNQHDKAEPLLQRSLEITEAHQGKDHLDVASALTDLADLYREMGYSRKALPLYQRNLAIREARQGKDSVQAAVAMLRVASAHFDLWQPAKAEQLYKRSLALLESRLGKEHRLVAIALSGLAGVHMAVGRRDQAEPLLVRSVKITEASQGKDHLDVAILMHNLAGLYMIMNQPDKARPLFERSLAIREARLGKDHPELGHTLNALALMHLNRGEFDTAEALLRRVLRIWEPKLGKNHWHLAVILDGLAGLYEDRGQPDEAEPLYRRSLAIMEASMGKDHPDTATPRNNLAALHAQKGDYREAARLLDVSRRGARKYVASILPALSDAEKAAFFAKTSFRRSFERALALGLARKADATLAGLSAAWLLNGKAVDQEGLASSLLLAREGGATMNELTRRLVSVRQRLARLSIARPRPGQEKKRLQEIDTLTAEEQDLGKQLRRAGSNGAAPAWVELGEVRQALPADAVLIDIARFTAGEAGRGKGKKEAPTHYAAWITARTGPVHLVDLGPAERIDRAVGQVRRELEGAVARIKADGQEKAEQVLREHLEEVSKLVLAPLLPHAGKARRLFISPDDNLWLLPFEALLLPDGKYVIEKQAVSYLTSGRDLLPGSAARVTASAPLVLADPDFDLDPGKANRPASADEESTRSLAGALRLGSVRRLPGFAVEARAIVPSLKTFTGVAPRVCLGADALEGTFKAARSPRVLVLCTHGFFLPVKAEAGAKWENPLLRCGLLLAGCNKADRAEGADDGVLTGLEVVGTDLRGTELVVLSACETGVGTVQTGEGVSGLRQAFGLAGARAVVATLWQVPDKASARLMALFFQNLSKGQNKAEALRAAKVQLIAERRDDFAVAHPFFWAAFTLTGQP